MKLAIVGAGALGLTFAAALVRVHDVVVLARRAPVAEALERDGITIVRGGGDDGERVTVRATADARVLSDRDAVIVAVKAYATEAALAPLRGVLRASALVASIQNGLDAAHAIRAALPGAHAVAGSTTQGAIRLNETAVRVMNDGATTFGRDDGASPASEDLAAAFRAAGQSARVADDIDTVLWRKLIVNAAINPLGALAGATNGAVGDDRDLTGLARTLAAEAAAVARAEGADAGDAWSLVEAAARATAANRCSMLQDVEAGRRTEIDAISGTIVRRARAHGIAVPLTETVLHLVRARECAGAPSVSTAGNHTTPHEPAHTATPGVRRANTP